MTQERKNKLAAMLSDLRAVEIKHNVIVDKYVKEDNSTEYRFKLQFEDVCVNIEDVFSVVYHGPPVKKTPN